MYTLEYVAIGRRDEIMIIKMVRQALQIEQHDMSSLHGTSSMIQSHTSSLSYLETNLARLRLRERWCQTVNSPPFQSPL